VRFEAARKDTSIASLLAGILKERLLEEDACQAALRRALARKPCHKLRPPRSAPDISPYRYRQAIAGG